MTYRIVRTTWWLLILSFMAGTAIAAIYCAYAGVCQLLSARWHAGASALALALVLGGATWLACRHRTDLIYG